MTRKVTFERILAAYLALAAGLAFALPYELRIENLLPISTCAIPFSRWLSLAPGSLPFLSTYFLILSALVPFVVTGLALRPQEMNQLPCDVPSLKRCTFATLLLFFSAILIWNVMFLDTAPREDSHRNERIAYYASVSRLGLSVFGPLVMGTTALVSYLALVKIPRMWIGYRRNQFG